MAKTGTKRKPKRKSTTGRRNGVLTARRADRYDLYLKSVQVPEYEVTFFNRVYRQAFGRPPRVLREDFCGTAAVCCEWVRNKPGRVAIGVDLDPEPVEWGKRHNVAKLKPADQQRIVFIRDDVRRVRGPKADVIAAENFSYFIFKTRPELLGYFKAARRNLAKQGVFVLDLMGGPEVMEEQLEDKRRQDGFTYIWEQARFDPISHHCSFYIHFHFKDGSKLHRAFEYHWRLWTIPEVSELLREAGFRQVDVYWEDTDAETGEGNDVFRRRKTASTEPTYIIYIVAIK